ncbi:hypothetical protein HPP92_014693 [Vanilla planifolia]|uniref:Uncharacterized protein n=1 Tax=Vanilla planifolia TaxID=51239 RepID=A0A835QGI1_VANPL|nr:hypothetical protein HPP92_014693 [Vanilla planifolia]
MGSENGGQGAVDREKKGLKLFGVRIVDGEKLKEEGAAARVGVGDVEAATKSMLKSLSMGNLVACTAIEAGEQEISIKGTFPMAALCRPRGGEGRKSEVSGEHGFLFLV